ncbi:protein FAR1-RELATED SEQUENCE 5-like [Chenopodium quinoa]|uniref:protein FAR1-RELATED SEQUENCE 5-like n=1 Tax=Chenopodium quinoa TaxID=63459 RepID=UPI000B7931B6|nr:protein FAR1-RELATED SEQUENCE 5-like [Chenopodium quinoa]
MARKMLILDDPFLQNCIEVECGSVGGHWAAGENVFVAEEVEGIPAEGVADVENLEEEVVIVGGSEEQDGAGEDEAHAAAIEELLKEVNVGEESYKTPTKGKSNVDISVEVEEFANVEVSLPPPTVGMVFDSWQKIDEYFRNYGKQEGFGVVRSCGATIGKGANAKDKRNVTWTCECYGLPGRKRKKTGSTFVNDSQICEEVLIKRKSKKVDYVVQLNATVNKDGDWLIKRVHLEHAGHNPTLSKSKNITKFRKKFLNDNPHLVQQLLNDRRAGVPEAQIFNCMARQRNGRDNMQFTQQDLHEEVAKKRKEQFEEGDTKAMFAYFKRMVDDNSNFFHTYRVDELGRLQDVLWVDARIQVAYEEFGDVVVFDSTYLTNEYKLPFCNFVGVNHHGQTILFGCALVSRETSETFEWVFSNWLRCMGEKKPIGILTDQDPAMRKALKVTMKESTHRWCIWHITKKFGKKLGKLPNYPAMHEDLENAIYDSLDSEEFESNWQAVIKKHELEADEWLTGLILRKFSVNAFLWRPCNGLCVLLFAVLLSLFSVLPVLFCLWFVVSVFCSVVFVGCVQCGGPSGLNKALHTFVLRVFIGFFDGYLSKNTLLSEFVERYVDALEVRSTSEKRADDNNERYVRQAYSDFPAELVF